MMMIASYTNHAVKQTTLYDAIIIDHNDLCTMRSSSFVYDAIIIMMGDASVCDASVCDASVCDASEKLKRTIPSLHCCVGHRA